MNSRKPIQTPVRPEEKIILDEMVGYCGLKMYQEALNLAQMFLEKKRMNAAQFETCVQVVDHHTGKSKRWQQQVEKAYSRLDPGDREQVRITMMFYYWRRKDSVGLARFLPVELTPQSESCDVMILWEYWLEQGRMAELENAIPIMMSAIKAARCPVLLEELSKRYADFWVRKLKLARDGELTPLDKDRCDGFIKFLSNFTGPDSSQNP